MHVSWLPRPRSSTRSSKGGGSGRRPGGGARCGRTSWTAATASRAGPPSPGTPREAAPRGRASAPCTRPCRRGTARLSGEGLSFFAVVFALSEGLGIQWLGACWGEQGVCIALFSRASFFFRLSRKGWWGLVSCCRNGRVCLWFALRHYCPRTSWSDDPPVSLFPVRLCCAFGGVSFCLSATRA